MAVQEKAVGLQDRKSDEASNEEIRLAKSQGDAFEQAVRYMTRKEAHGGIQPAGDYLVGYAVEDAEGLYSLQNGQLVWHNPTDENAHIEVVVLDGADHRFIPDLDVTVTVLDARGDEVGTHPQPFLWHSWVYHYGRNWHVPGDGTYTLRISIEPPTFMRHDKVNGKRYAQPVQVEFRNVRIQTGQKKS